MKRNLRQFRFLFLLLLLFFCNAGMAWNAAGHQLMAAMTWDLMDAQEQQYWADILKHHPRYLKDFKNKIPKHVKFNPGHLDAWLFRQASVWPDIARGFNKNNKDKYHHGPWHYINFPIYLNGKTDTSFLNLDESGKQKLDNHLNIVQALKGNLAILNKQGATKKQKAIALCWVLHLEGDLYQPLHTTALFSRDYFPKGDQGGNLIKISGQGRIKNLHWYWDSRLNNSTSFKIIDVKARKLIQKYHAMGINFQDSTLKQIALNSHNKAKKYVYTPVLKSIINEKENQKKPQTSIYISNLYDKQARQIAAQQITKAAYQTAKILKNQK